VSNLKRLQKELAQILKTPDNDIYLRPVGSSTGSLLNWTAMLRGPADTPFEGGIYVLSITCPSEYPLSPPSMVFLTKVFHPNVDFKTGAICLDILKNQWSPAWSLSASCRAVLSLLTDPNDDSPLNCDAGNMIRDNDMDAFNSMAAMYNYENARCYKWPESEEEKLEKKKKKEREEEDEEESKKMEAKKAPESPCGTSSVKNSTVVPVTTPVTDSKGSAASTS
jgi:peroxin-4